MSAATEHTLSTARPPHNLQDLHELHKKEVKSYHFESKCQSLLGGQSPYEVVLTGHYVPIHVAQNDMRNEGPESSCSLEGTVRAVLSQNQDAPRVVAILGAAGVGKTTALQKIVIDWSQATGFHHFLFIFPFALRDLSLEYEMSLVELLMNRHGHLSSQSLALILQNPQSLLFLFDGIEQGKHRLEASSDSALCTNVNRPCSLSVLITSLIHGKLLPGASILMTARSAARLESFSEAGCHYVQVLGFCAPERRVYFHQILKDPENAEKALQHAEKKMGLNDLSSRPGFCWTLCSLLKDTLENGDDLPETVTQVYVKASVSVLCAHPLEDVAQARALLLSLGKLALHCSASNKVFCSREDVATFGLQQFLSSPLLSSFLSLDGDPVLQDCVLSFHSPTVQEFLVAVACYLDGSGDESVSMMLARLMGNVEFLEVFLSGLSDTFQRKPLEGIVGKFSEDRIADFTKWLAAVTEDALQTSSREKHLTCFRLLHQSQNPALVKESTAIPSIHLGSYELLTVWDAVAFNYIFVCSGAFDKMDLYGNRLTGEMLQHLVPALSLSCNITLSSCILSVDSYTHLASALREGKAVELDLSYSNSTGDAAVKELCVVLKDCSLQVLRLPVCGVRAGGCVYLASVLAEPTSQLRELDLRGNELGDQGLINLSQGLSSQHCRLQHLGLHYCGLTEASMEAFAQAILDGSPELTNLCLTNNIITDVGMHQLARALKSSTCKLQYLSVFDCGLTGACCEELAAALRSGSCSLLELDLSVNELEDAGALQLCEALKVEGCTLQSLGLVRCELSEVTFQALGSVLTSGKSRLRKLSVGLNTVGDRGADHLWKALVEQQCPLESLDLEMIELTDGSLAGISALLRANTSLKTLVLKNNYLTDASVPALVQLVQESKTMKKLNVQYNDFSEDVFELMDTCEKIKY